MPNVKLIAASIASLTIIGLTPLSAYASSPACEACYRSCFASAGGDEYLYAECVSLCLDSDGTFCQGDIPG